MTTLACLVAEDQQLSEVLQITCPATRREQLRARIREDFAQNEVEICNRWVLSRTECLIAALRT